MVLALWNAYHECKWYTLEENARVKVLIIGANGRSGLSHKLLGVQVHQGP